MHKLYDLKEILCEELENYASRGQLDMGSLDVVDKLAHALKNVNKIIDGEAGYSRNSYDEGGYGRYDGNANRSMRSMRSYRNSYKRDSMGRYARSYSQAADDMAQQLREMMEDAPDDQMRQRIEKLLHEIEQ